MNNMNIICELMPKLLAKTDDKEYSTDYIWMVINLAAAIMSIKMLERMKIKREYTLMDIIELFFGIHETQIRLKFSPAVFPVPRTTSKICFGRCFNEHNDTVFGPHKSTINPKIHVIIHAQAIFKFSTISSESHSNERDARCCDNIIMVICHEIVHAFQMIEGCPVSEYEAELYANELKVALCKKLHSDYEGEQGFFDYLLRMTLECALPTYQGNPIDLR